MRQQCISSGGQPKIKVLADADVVLELFINRQRFIEGAEKLLTEIAQSQQAEVYVTDKCLKRIRLEEGLSEEAALFVEKMLCDRVIKIDSSIREQARTYCLPDYDSAEEVVCAKNEQLNAIVTQNPQNFDGADSSLIWSVENLLTRLQLNKNLLTEYAEENLEILTREKFSSNIIQENLTKSTLIIIGDSCSGKTTYLTALRNLEDLALDITFQFFGHDSFKKLSRTINCYWSPQIIFDDFDDWINSDEALLLFRNNYPLWKNDYFSRKSRIKYTIFSNKYLHKYLINFLKNKFPKKTVNDYYDLRFNYSPHQLQLLQHHRWIWRLKLSITVAFNTELVPLLSNTD